MDGWHEVTKSAPCPVCEKPDWCGVTVDGTVARCMRVESDKPSNGGWIHRLDGSVATLPPRRRNKATQSIDFAKLANEYQAAVRSDALEGHAKQLGVSAASLSRLGIGWDGEAWTFPMRDATGRVLGIRRRLPSGKMLSVRGGREGLFVPSELPKTGTLYDCEGPTDTAAILTLGLVAIGRPSCRGSVQLTREVCKGRANIVVADNDMPGLEGAQALANELVPVCESVRVIRPPREHKDVRAWVASGATKQDVERAALQAVMLHPAKTASKADGTDESPPFRPYILSQCMADIPAEGITWLWPGRIPFGKLTVVAGDPGLGKSWLTLDLASRLSAGVGWPDIREPVEPCSSIIVSGEDDPRDTLRPRLEKAGADLTRIHCVGGVQRSLNGDPGYLSLDLDIQALENLVNEVGAKLLVIDPVACFLGDTNSHRDADVRAVLGPLSDLSNRTRCSVLAVSHLSKSGQGKAQYRVMGSLAFIAAARVGWLVAKDPDDDKRRLMLPLKANIIEDPQGIAFEIQDGALHWFTDPVTVDADTVLSVDAHTGRTERNEAVAWLGEQLAHGPVEVPELKKCAEAECVGWRTVERVKKQLGVVSLRKGYGKGAPWSWQLPTDASQTPPTNKWRPLDNDPENAVFAKDRQTPESGGLCGDGNGDGLTRSGLTPDRGAILVLRDRMSRTDDPNQRAALQAEIDGIQAILAKT